MSATQEHREGWGFPPGSRKCHYFRDGMSLCRRWGFAFALRLEPDNGRPSKDDCAPCRRAFDREQAAS